MDPAPLVCSRCGALLRSGRGEYYLVRIEAIADPSPPEITEEGFDVDSRAEIGRLLASMENLSEQEAMDQVYRRLALTLCNACYQVWIEHPVGGSD